ncbi:MAG: 16S rRNA (adenine(1518)-N(6)/adenine(1519)-N(6))-dimethyltransferase RsmA [Legionella sp.]|nr:16S rRNA (adenine(1518)-N(6)/adenine(1519)-N(6))-dimethyltransferase RsmA [Legionella sp.]
MKHNPRKRFGQNFLQNQQIIHEIIQAIHPQSSDKVIEIGPGLGALTLPLLRSLKKLTAIEIDRDLLEHLKNLELPPSSGQLQLLSADALTLDYSQFGGNLRIVGNLPYNISTPLMLRLLKYTPFIEDMYFMLQKEVVDRMAAVPGTKAYGRLSVMLQYHCEVNFLFTVPPESFMPAPKVNSAMVQLVPYQQSPYDHVGVDNLEKLVAQAFAMRRKTLFNNLKGHISAEQLHQLGIDGNKRPEQISIKEYVQLAKIISI